MNTDNKKYAFLLALVVIIGIAVYLYDFQVSKKDSDPVGKVSIAASLTLSPAPIWIAHDKGFFKQVGLDATVRQYSSGKTTTEAMLKGEIDLSSSAEFLAVKKSFNHKELRILSTTAFVHQIKLLGLKERGIEKLSDIKGKRIGVRLGTNGEYFLARLLTLNGMQRKDIKWVNMPPQNKADALAQGEVDGVITWPPFVQQIETRLGDRLVSFDGQPGQDYYYLLLTRKDWIEANPLIAQRVMLAMKKAELWIKENPQQAKEYMASKFNVDVQKMEQVLAVYRYSISLPQTLLTAMEAENRWLLSLGNTRGQPVTNFLDLIVSAPLQKASPTDVTIIR